MREFGAFAAALVAERRKEPGDDLVSGLVTAGDESGIEERHLVMLVLGLVVAGHQTTMTALGNIVVHLLTDRKDAWPGLAEDEEAAATAVEQLLRTVPLSEGRALPGLIRRAAADVEVGGVTIPAGSVVAVQTNSANRDPEVFPPGPPDLFAPLNPPSVVFGASSTTASAPGSPAWNSGWPCTAWPSASPDCEPSSRLTRSSGGRVR